MPEKILSEKEITELKSWMRLFFIAGAVSILATFLLNNTCPLPAPKTNDLALLLYSGRVLLQSIFIMVAISSSVLVAKCFDRLPKDK